MKLLFVGLIVVVYYKCLFNSGYGSLRIYVMIEIRTQLRFYKDYCYLVNDIDNSKSNIRAGMSEEIRNSQSITLHINHIISSIIFFVVLWTVSPL